MRSSLKHNGSAVAVVNVGGAVTCPGALGRISPGGQATMAEFLPIPANDKVVPVYGFVQSRKKRIWQISDKFCVTMKLLRWRAENVTSLLPQPSGLCLGVELKLSW
jgi:hypothetical protein